LEEYGMLKHPGRNQFYDRFYPIKTDVVGQVAILEERLAALQAQAAIEDS
jgi:hypothetical protein